MNERNLVICDHEIHYAHRLGENLLGRNELAVRIFVCTDPNKVRRFQEQRQIHILVLSDKVWRTQEGAFHAEQIFVMTSELGLHLRENETEIYRFQSADCIFAEIFETYSTRTNHTMLKHVKKKRQKVFAVYSPIHRIGKTELALAIGKELAKEAKTLYINLEPYTDIGGRFRQTEGRNLGDLLYYMKQERGNVALRLAMMVMQIEKLDYIPPIQMGADLIEMKPEEWSMLFSEILQNGIYENVILDIGDNVQGLFEILQMCDKIYMPLLEDEISMRKVEQYDAALQKLKLKGVQANTRRFIAVDDMETYARELVKEDK